ncbi:MAG: ABC transporter ATP-binding protein [Myxococcales bacterium]|nr:ABC transporter ATP-binding protein [Myxococcales bacterium]
MIEVTDLTKLYRERAAVDHLSFSVEAGEVLGFLGPNGAGKTTTMRILTGFLPATDGSAKVAGFDVFESPLEVKRRIGYLPEQPPVYLDMTVQDYLAFCARLKGVQRKAFRGEIDRAIGATRLGDARERLIGNLSKGFRQRVGLAQAILGSPPVLILDEPTVGLDPVQIIEVRALIRDLAKTGEHTIILSTHILHEVAELCQKVLIIKAGQRVGFDTIEGLRGQLVDGHRASLEEIYLRLIDPVSASASLSAPSSSEERDAS